MSILASFALLALLPQAPPGNGQGGTDPEGRPPLLTPAEQQVLRDKVSEYMKCNDAYDRATAPKDREKTGKKREASKEALEKEWDKMKKRGHDLYASMADLRAIYDNCFLVERPEFSLGNLRSEKPKGDGKGDPIEYSFFLPKTYKADKPMRTVIVLPGTAAAGAPAWAKPADYFAAVWDKTTALNDTIFQVCHVPQGLELDPVPDWSREGQADEEQRRINAVWSGFGPVINAFNVDRPRVFLDCGRATCGFGVRFVSVFPDRFAGLILRQPIDVPDIRLGSLLGMPVLMVQTAATAADVAALKGRLEAITPDSVTVVEATDDYPHKGASAAIEAWMQKQRRNIAPKKVVIEPNHDRFHRSYWAAMDRVEPLSTAGPDDKPRLEVEADRATNRITVKAQGVDSFLLYLNDDLVDLDKEFTVVINDKASTEKRTRNPREMEERLLVRRDWEYLFPVAYHATVPKAEPPKAEPKK
jgi:hypothetical protein